MVQVVELLPNKSKGLNSNPSTAKKKKKDQNKTESKISEDTETIPGTEENGMETINNVPRGEEVIE
jgi:hypothetical protein